MAVVLEGTKAHRDACQAAELVRQNAVASDREDRRNCLLPGGAGSAKSNNGGAGAEAALNALRELGLPNG